MEKLYREKIKNNKLSTLWSVRGLTCKERAIDKTQKSNKSGPYPNLQPWLTEVRQERRAEKLGNNALKF